MGHIIILDENTANQIAAGEVIERPASVIKELVENSVDAGATKITVEIKNGGVSYMRVTDNGSGIQKDDVVLAFERHGTGKIRNADDIRVISTMGFRGEALPSIASVADVVLTTANKADPLGTRMRVRGGRMEEQVDIGCPLGTVITVKDLFFNTPARFKFLRSDTTEARTIHDILVRTALAHPNISFTYIDSGKEVFRTPGDDNVKSAIYATYGKEITDALIDVSYKDEYATVKGFIGNAQIAAGNRNRQSFFVNKRYVKSKTFVAAIEQAYKTLLMKNRYPFAVLYLDINYEAVDVNVHPAKTEVRFSDEQALFRTLYHGVSNALMSKTHRHTGSVQISEIIQRESRKDAKPERRQSDITRQVEPSKKLSVESKESKESPKIVEEQKKDLDFIKPAELSQKSQDFVVTNKIQGLLGENKTREVPDGYDSVKDIEEKVPEIAPTPQIPQVIEYTPEPEPEPITGIKTLVYDYKIVGTAYDTYIFIQQGNNLYIIDQHAAHEKTLFEKLVQRIREGDNVAGQILLKPQTVDLSDEDMNTVEEYKKELNAAGYLIDEFGDNTVLLREIPYAAGDVPPIELFIDAVNLLESSKGMNRLGIKEELVYDMACKAAVKASKKLSEPEIRALIRGLVKLKNPETCPHGRPIYITMDKKDFEKMFKRII